ncbi:hypothetical protein AAE478_004408 [Parahypoxylon ruwenzoriense]
MEPSPRRFLAVCVSTKPSRWTIGKHMDNQAIKPTYHPEKEPQNRTNWIWGPPAHAPYPLWYLKLTSLQIRCAPL